MALALSRYWNPANLLAIWGGVKNTRFKKDLEPLFPFVRTVEEKISRVKGFKRTDVILNLCDPDSKATIRGTRKLTREEYMVPEFRESIMLHNSEVRELTNYIEQYAGVPDAMSVLDNKWQDYLELMNGAYVNAEYFRAQLLQYGKFVFRNRSDDGTMAMVQADFDSDKQWEAHNVTYATSDWTDPAADIIGDLEALRERFKDANGSEEGSVLIMNSRTWHCFEKNAAINALLLNMRWTRVSDWLSNLGLSVKLADGKFQRELLPTSGASEKYIEDGNICMVPSEKLGDIVCPECDLFRDMLKSHAVRYDVGFDSETGIMVRCKEMDDPDRIQTFVEAHLFPRFDPGQMEKCCVMRAVPTGFGLAG